MKKIDFEVFCNEIINFDANKKNYWDMMDDAILKSLKLKGKKIPKEFDYRNYEDKSVYFKKINKSLSFINLLRIEDGDNVNYLNCGMRFVSCSDPINKGKLGSSRSFLNQRDREYY